MENFYIYKTSVYPLQALQTSYKMCMFCCEMPGLGQCETYSDSLIEITIEHEGKITVAKGNKQQEKSLCWIFQTKWRKSEGLFALW